MFYHHYDRSLLLPVLTKKLKDTAAGLLTYGEVSGSRNFRLLFWAIRRYAYFFYFDFDFEKVTRGQGFWLSFLKIVRTWT